jgi:hypothetical protein
VKLRRDWTPALLKTTLADSRDQCRFDRLRASQCLRAPATDDDAIAARKKSLRKREADAAGASGNEDRAVAQCHALVL